MINIIEYKVYFTYIIDNIYEWCDNFELNEEWQILRIKGCRNIEKVYMNRSPYIKPKNKYEIALYTKNKWIYLNKGKGEMTSFTKNIKIKNLEIKNVKIIPIIVTYKTKFEIQAMLFILKDYEDLTILEKGKINGEKTKIIYKNMKITLYHNIIVYRGEDIKNFEMFCIDIEEKYKNESHKILDIFKHLDPIESNLYMSLAYKTWFRAKRLNQKEWPLISEKEVKNGIKFNGVWYYHPTLKVKLAERKDDNDEIYIPKTYKENNEKPKNQLPYSIKTDEYKKAKFIKWWENEKCVIIDYKGKIIEADKKPEVIVYNNMIIDKTEKRYKSEGIVQILNKEGDVCKIIDENNNIKQYNGIKIRGIKCVPWYYKHILHDYNKLGRLKKGDYMDLMDIGIVKKNEKKIITWPDIDNLYIGKGLETERLITFKHQPNVKINSI